MTTSDTQAVVTPTDSSNGEAGRLCVQRMVGHPSNVLNLYAGVGGNRKLWQDVHVTAVELEPKIAAVYQRQIGRAHV